MTVRISAPLELQRCLALITKRAVLWLRIGNKRVSKVDDSSEQSITWVIVLMSRLVSSGSLPIVLVLV